MRELLRHIGSVHHLVAFEAAARLGSFTHAAREMGVTQPAVSQSVRQLERALGEPLFVRGHRSIALTEAGVLLYHDVTGGFDRILSTVRQVRRIGGANHVTVSVSTAFANYWMVPRLQDFRANHTDADLRVQTTDKELDIVREGISLAIRRGDGNWPGYHAQLIAEDVIMAVASPTWLAANGPITDIEHLSRAALIHLEEPHRWRPTWRDWFYAMGTPYHDVGDGLRLNDYALVLQAAMAGEGVAFGWQHVTDGLIEKNLLAPVRSWQWKTGLGFYLVWSDQVPLTEPAITVRDWILAQSDRQRAGLTNGAVEKPTGDD